jgi:hypothetical protein
MILPQQLTRINQCKQTNPKASGFFFEDGGTGA